MFTRTAASPIISESALSVLPKTAPAVFQNAVNAMANQVGIIDIRTGNPIQIRPYVKTTKVKIVNPNNAKSLDAKPYIFNEGKLKSTAVDAAAYAGDAPAEDRITTSYNDGFGGKYIDELIRTANGGLGLQCEELTLIAKNEDGDLDDAVIEDLDLTIQSYNPVNGDPMPYKIDPSEALRNTANKNGMVTMKVDFWVNSITQLTFKVAKGQEVQLKFKWANQAI